MNLCQYANMYEHVIVETLSGTFNAILGGNVYYVMLHVNAATLRGLTSFILCLIPYNVVLENHSVQNSPWGEGSIASSRPSRYKLPFMTS